MGTSGGPVGEEEKEANSIARAAGLVSALILFSRLLGLVREQLFAALPGAGPHADAFRIAFRMPTLPRDMFGGGAPAAVFVPPYGRVLKEEGREGAHRLAPRLLTLLAVVLGILALVAIAFARPLVALLAP